MTLVSWMVDKVGDYFAFGVLWDCYYTVTVRAPKLVSPFKIVNIAALDFFWQLIRRKNLIFCLNLKTEDFFTHLWHLTCNLIWQFVTFYSKEHFKKNFKDSLNTFFLLFANDKRMIFLIVCTNACNDNFHLQKKILFWITVWKIDGIFCYSDFTWNQICCKWEFWKGSNCQNAWFSFLFLLWICWSDFT